ncbi:hypothetical protein POM88_026218 [Heracleum sosnowskyi]|uniref:Uncharacterized protein n=1 Tax=Heracleum sosnowskyi TaxID=360622 RepID=A0AAD8MNY2_9APIA|nr:hypothetical protein POM88_026218 [Heracleum sosnowskyi]
MGCITRSKVLKIRELLNNGCVLTGFIDGSWKLDSNGEIVAGIGGLIMDHEGTKRLEFIGPVKVRDALHAEWEVLRMSLQPFLIVLVVKMEEGNINVNARWIMPPKGMIKINVHSFFSDQQLPNGNYSANWKTMVRIKRPFGRIMEIWNSDRGLGEIEPRFEVVLEEDINRDLTDGDVENPKEEPGVAEAESRGENDDLGEQEDLEGMDM